MRLSILMTILVTVATAATVSADDVSFTQKPTVQKNGNQFQINFTVSHTIDVEVAILDKSNTVVRHLAAGILGENAPAPFQKASKKQTIYWDGKDDQGQVAEGGPFRVRVRLGLSPTLDEMLGDNPSALGSVRALTVGPTGELFVFHVFGELHPSDGSPMCSVFDRDGNYLRTIMPFPADIPDNRLRGLKRLTVENGTKIPFLYQAETRSLLPGAGDLPAQRPVVTSDGRLAFVGIQEGPKRYAQAGLNKVIVIRSDDGAPAEGFHGVELSKNSTSGASLALAPDERTLYASGLRMGSGRNAKPTHVVYAFGWGDEAPRVFAGKLKMPGADDKHLNNPRDVTVDQDGNVYVSDRNNNRVVVFQSDGTLLGSLEVELPERVQVHKKTGAVYVIGGERIDQLQKFASWKADQPVANLKLPSFRHPRYTAVMALDQSSKQPILWVASPKGRYAKFDLLRIVDKGNQLDTPVDIGRKNKGASPAAGPVLGMTLDHRRKRLFVNTQIYDLTEKKWSQGIRESGGKSIGNSGVGSFGLDGNFYTQIYPKIVRRIGPDLKPIPFAKNASIRGDLLNPIKGTMRARGRGISADRFGNVYVLWEDNVNATRGQAFNHLYVYAPDGSLKTEKLVDSRIRSLNSIRLDSTGNIYLALGLRPGEEQLPPGLEGQLPQGAKDPDAVGGVNTYPLIYGSIVKFGPEGGVIKPDCDGMQCNYAFGTPMEVKGAKWIFPGASPVVSWRTPGTPDICNCESPRFDVDSYGRTFFPDAARFRVGMLDTNGNLIGWFGTYGNVDSKGNSANGRNIPFYWPYSIAIGSKHVYVGDRLNRRVAAVGLEYAQTETCDIP